MITLLMKRFLTVAAVAVSVVLAVSCTKEGAPRFKGNYTFKTSGTITVRPSGDEAAETVRISLSDESGQMDIVTADKSSGNMVVAMNIVGGSVMTFDAVADGKTLTVTPFSRQLTVPADAEGGIVEISRPKATVTVTGYAERYTDALLFWTYTWQGVEYEIVDSDISCWAKEN